MPESKFEPARGSTLRACDFSAVVTLLSVLLCLSVSVVKGADAPNEAELIKTLQSSASPAEKDAACARLKFIGTPRCVPALAALLTDEQLSHSARYALESIHFHPAGQALLNPSPLTTGLTRLGILPSLATRREAWVEPALARLLRDSDVAAASAAARALGEIASPAAVRALQSARRSAPGPLYPALVDAELRCANHLLSSGRTQKARSIFQSLYNEDPSESIRVAAYRGLVLASRNDGLKLVARGISGPPGPAQLASVQLVSELPVPETSYEISRLLPRLAPPLQVALIEGLAQRNDPAAAPAITALAGSAQPQVQLAVIQALGPLGDSSSVPLLADFAASGTPEQQTCARQALTELRRGDVNGALVTQLSTSGPDVQAELARALGARTARSALPSLMELVQTGPARVRQCAFQAIGVLADNPQLPALVGFVLQAPDASFRSEAAEALNVAYHHILSRHAVDVQPLVEGVSGGTVDARVALLPICSGLRAPEIRMAMRLAVQDPHPRVRQAAVRALCDTVDPEMLDDLVALAQSTHDEKFRSLAIQGAVRLTIDEKDRITADHRVGALRELLATAARPEQKRLVFAGLAEVPDPDALRVVEPELTDAPVQPEASLAAIKIAAALPSSEAQNSEKILQTALASATSDSTRQALEGAIRQIEANADYISDWQVAGPYSQKGKTYSDLFDIVFPPELEDPKNVPWKYLPAGADPQRPWVMDLLKALGGGTQCVAYARTWIHSDKDQPALLELGSDDGIKVWLNDKQVYALNASRSLQPGSDKVPVQFHSGWNQVLFKITQNNQGWGFCARFRKPDGSHLEGLRSESAPKASASKTPTRQTEAKNE